MTQQSVISMVGRWVAAAGNRRLGRSRASLKKDSHTPNIGKGVTYILPGDAPGSLGDEAMVRSMMSVAEKHGYENVRAVSTCAGAWWPDVKPEGHQFMPWLYRALPGASAREFADGLGSRDHIVWIAADTIDGGHNDRHLTRTLSALHAWIDCGAKVSVVNFSLRGGSSLYPEALRLLSRAENVVVRDTTSASLLRAQSHCDFVLAPDVAYSLLDSRDFPERPVDSRTEIVGVNLSGHAVEKEGASGLVSAVGSALASFSHAHRGIEFELIPHDIREGSADDRPYLEKLGTVLSESGVGNRTIPGGLTPADLRARLAYMPIVLTARMHLAIATLSSGRVPVCITYFHDKFVGQMNLIGLPLWLLIPAGDATEASVLGVLERAYSERVALQKIVTDAIPTVRANSISAIAEYLGN